LRALLYTHLADRTGIPPWIFESPAVYLTRGLCGGLSRIRGPWDTIRGFIEPDIADFSSTERRGELPAVIVNKVSSCELSVGAQKYAHRGIARQPHAFNMCLILFFNRCNSLLTLRRWGSHVSISINPAIRNWVICLYILTNFFGH